MLIKDIFYLLVKLQTLIFGVLSEPYSNFERKKHKNINQYYVLFFINC